VQRLRTSGILHFVIASPDGRMSPWYTASLGDTAHGITTTLEDYQKLFDYTPGISHTVVGKRVEFEKDTDSDDAPQITYTSDPREDFWKTLRYPGPWRDDLTADDKSRTEWGEWAYLQRNKSARLIQLQRERREIDQTSPPVLSERVQAFPLAGALLVAVAGSAPDLQRASKAALAVLRDPATCFFYFAEMVAEIVNADDIPLLFAFSSVITVALLDPELTDCGRRRAWLRNAAPYEFTLETLPVDLTAPAKALHSLWQQCTEPEQLIDSGLYCTPASMPCAITDLTTGMNAVKVEGGVEDLTARIDTLLYEAREARQWSVPWGARVAVEIGPFNSLRIYEMDGEFACHFLDNSERFYLVSMGLRGGRATYASLPILRSEIKEQGEQEWNEKGRYALLLIAAAIIRDFLVVEDRESVFTGRSFRRRRHGQNLISVIYLPRVRYSRPSSKRPPVDGDTLARARHSVAQHLRKAKHSSEQQRLLAQKYGVSVPPGYTFVRPHARGGVSDTERLRIYRSRSASLMLYDVVDPGPNTTTPEWFKFERDCAKVLRSRGMDVVHHAANAKDGDGGMDLFCVDANQQKWVAQCKCWALHRAVGPEVVRELGGAMQLVDAGTDSTSRGILLTTSTFSSGAVLAAKELSIELIDGAHLASLIAACETSVT
jgi:hypothetical protein